MSTFVYGDSAVSPYDRYRSIDWAALRPSLMAHHQRLGPAPGLLPRRCRDAGHLGPVRSDTLRRSSTFTPSWVRIGFSSPRKAHRKQHQVGRNELIGVVGSRAALPKQLTVDNRIKFYSKLTAPCAAAADDLY